jgi:hypothetical protein
MTRRPKLSDREGGYNVYIRIVYTLLTLLALALINSAYALTCPVPLASSKSLMVTDLSVVEDPARTAWRGSMTTASDGAWSFGRLMANMAGPHNPSDFVRNWLKNWETARQVNHFTVAARPNIKSLVIDPWPRLQNGKLDLTRAPMRLLAIVYRPDLRDLSKRKAGEGRFVFGVLDPAGAPLSFTVILEYSLPAKTKTDVRKWALAFQKLSTLKFGSTYNRALEKITTRFTGKNVAPTNINGSGISQVRTNEIALNSPWELREFRLHTRNKSLREVTVQQTPALDFNNATLLADWVNANAAAIIGGSGNKSIEVPFSFNGIPFRAGAIANNIDVWDSSATNREAMFRVAINTCNGCHGAETTTGFLHISPRERGSASSLSGFITGTTTGTPGTTTISVSDPRDGSTTREFNELEFRKADLAAIICPAHNTSAAAPPDALGRATTGKLDRGPGINLAH